jgi:hypothetical protein
MSIKNKIHVQEYVYDFAVDGGVKDANIVLSDKAGSSNIPVGAIIKSVLAKVVTAVEGTSSTVSWGTTASAAGYSGTTIAEATLVDNFVVNGWDLGATLLWDDTNDHPLTPYVSSAADGSFAVLISTADLTAGKIVFGVEYWLPTEL